MRQPHRFSYVATEDPDAFFVTLRVGAPPFGEVWRRSHGWSYRVTEVEPWTPGAKDRREAALALLASLGATFESGLRGPLPGS